MVVSSAAPIESYSSIACSDTPPSKEVDRNDGERGRMRMAHTKMHIAPVHKNTVVDSFGQLLPPSITVKVSTQRNASRIPQARHCLRRAWEGDSNATAARNVHKAGDSHNNGNRIVVSLVFKRNVTVEDGVTERGIIR